MREGPQQGLTRCLLRRVLPRLDALAHVGEVREDAEPEGKLEHGDEKGSRQRDARDQAGKGGAARRRTAPEGGRAVNEGDHPRLTAKTQERKSTVIFAMPKSTEATNLEAPSEKDNRSAAKVYKTAEAKTSPTSFAAPEGLRAEPRIPLFGTPPAGPPQRLSIK